FKSLPNLIGGQGVLTEVVVSDRQIGVGQSKFRVQLDGFFQCRHSIQGAFLSRQAASFRERREGIKGRRGSPLERQIEFLQRRWLFAELAAKIGGGHAEGVQRFTF